MCTTMKPHFTALQEQRKDGETHKSEKSSIQSPLGLSLFRQKNSLISKGSCKKQTSRYTQCKTPAHSIKMFIKTVILISLYSSFVKQKLRFFFPGSFVKANARTLLLQWWRTLENARLSMQSLVRI